MKRNGARHLSVVLVVAASIAAFLPSLRFGYVQDDAFAIERNAVLERGDVREILRSDYWAGTPGRPDPALYRPVTIGSFALERRIVGRLSPALSHVVNLALHAATALLLLLFARRLGCGETGALAAALLFAVHPIHTSAVVNLVGRAEILATLFSIATLLALSHAGSWRPPGIEHGPRLRRLAAWGAAALAFLAFGSKETAIALPALVLFLEWAFRPPERSGRPVERAGATAPFALAVVVYLVLRTAAIGAFPGSQLPLEPDNPLVTFAPASRWATALAMVWHYAKLLLWPFRLSGDYSGSAIPVETSLLALRPLAGIAILAALVAAISAGVLRRQDARARISGMAAATILAPYLIVGNLVVLSGAGFAERLLYFPSAGFCLLVGAAAGPVLEARGKRVVAAFAAAVAIAGIAGSIAATADWRSDEALMRGAIRNAPGTVRAPLVLGRMAADAGRPDEALRLLDEALRAWPEHGPAWLDKGILLARRSDLPAAESALRKAASISPDQPEIRAVLGAVLAREGKDGDAERELKRALALDRGRLDAAEELGDLCVRQGRFAEAAHFYRGCVVMGRTSVQAKLERAERASGGSPSKP